MLHQSENPFESLKLKQIGRYLIRHADNGVCNFGQNICKESSECTVTSVQIGHALNGDLVEKDRMHV